MTVAALCVGASSSKTVLALVPQESAVAGQREVESLIAEYGNLGRIRRLNGGVHISVRVRSHVRLAEAFGSEAARPLGRIMADGNTLRFQYQGVPFVLDHVV